MPSFNYWCKHHHNEKQSKQIAIKLVPQKIVATGERTPGHIAAQLMPPGMGNDTSTSGHELSGFTAKLLHGGTQSIDDYADNVLLIVNTASHCSFTSQYTGLEALYLRYQDRGFVILGFPCNQFGALPKSRISAK